MNNLLPVQQAGVLMALHDKIFELRESRMRNGGPAAPDAFQGVTKDRLHQVLGRIDLADNLDLIDAVFALLGPVIN
jgi:hypothetical protein